MMSIRDWFRGKREQSQQVRPIWAHSFEPLEPRLLLNADSLGTRPLVDPGVPLDEQAIIVDLNHEDSAKVGELLGEGINNQIIFIDSAVDSGFQLNNEGWPGIPVVVLDGGRDGIGQITETLCEYNNLSAIHIISHGAPGQVTLGAATLSLSSLNGYADDLVAWGESLAEEGDILLYGCSVGMGHEGDALIQGLAGLTADVAASNDPTGPAELGGDWVLETATGPVEALSLNDGAISGVRGLLAAGDLDPTFGTDGIVTTGIGASYDEGRSVALQSDGKIVVAGSSYIGSGYDFALARYDPNGWSDTSFGGGTGTVTTPIGASNDYGYSVALQSDGKIVVAGFSYNGRDNDFALVRYHPNGSLDTSFGGTGTVTTPIGASADDGCSVAIQSDGKIVVTGYSFNGSNFDFALVRYTPNGSLDTSFGGTGKVTTPIGPSTDIGYSVAIQSDGKIVVAGSSNNGSNYDFALVRYNPDGSLDPSFGGTGKVTTPLGPSTDNGYSVAIQSDGKIVVAGSSSNGSNNDFALVRYEGDPPEITVLGNGVSIADGDTTPSTTDHTDFGSVAQGGTAISRTFTVRNDGSAALTLGTVNVPTGFTLTGGLTSSLAPGASDVFTVRLDTTTTGIKTGDVFFSTNDSDENPFNFRITGTVTTGGAPEITVLGNGVSIADGDTTPSLADHTNFGSVAQGDTPISRTYTVRNDGTGTLTLGAVTVPAGFTLTEGLVGSLAPGASDTFTVRLDTTTAGTKAGTVYFACNDASEGPNFSFRITGTVTATGNPEITVLGNGVSIADGDTTPSLADHTDFGSVAQGGSAISRTFTVRNDGTATLTLGTVTVPTGFTLTEGLSTGLAAGASDTFTVRLDTATTGTKVGTLYFACNDASEGPNFSFRITGTVTQSSGPEITVEGNGVSITDGDATPRAADHTDFGSVAQGGTAINRTFTVRNDGTATLTLGTVTVPTGFTLTEGLSASLAAGASDTFTVQLDTATAGTKTGEITFTTNDGDENPFNFTITGTVTVAGDPEITVLGNGLSIADGDTTPSLADHTNFGSVAQGGTGISRTFTVRNDGTGTLTLGAVTVPTGFALTEGLVGSLAAGASDTFTVRLDTAVAGTKVGTLYFACNDANEGPNFSFRITGTVVA